ncbi:MAG: VPLPA-CTERM-specific exosortase XrtD [Gammaproteobacteria bacterium]
MNQALNETHVTYWRSAPPVWLAAVLLAAIGVAVYYSGIDLMVRWWSDREEYSHGFLIPLITLYLVWQRLDRLRELPFTGSWGGAALAVLALGGYVLGELATIYTVIQYAFVLFVIGASWAMLGTRAFRVVAVPLGLLFLMVPFPNFIYNSLSSQLQLLSSSIGVAVIRLFGVSVYLEGNVIDLGSYKLQVVEACNGLRYLFPLMTLGVIVAYFYQAALWKRLLIFVSTLPITILMNSFRIGVIGVMVEYWGQSMAEGFLHDFEGWVIFMACFGILFIEMWMLMRLTGDRRPLGEVFGLDPPRPADPRARWSRRTLPPPALALVVAALLACLPARSLPEREEIPPARVAFGELPLQLDGWSGRRGALEPVYLDALKLDDYALIDYRRGGSTVNFYAAWYDSQKKGQSAHSPKSCLPGGGWVMEHFDTIAIEGAAIDGVPLEVNRVLISMGESRQLVWYWFQQRGRVVTNEYLVKWFVFWDALTRNRTDGALVRLVLPLRPGEEMAEGDAVLRDFVSVIVPGLARYIPR